VLHLQWSTVVFQLLNFVILLAVLARFLYRPLMQVMRRREEDVAKRLRDAEERAKRAEVERAQLAEASRAAQAEAEALLTSARAEAARVKEEELTRARQETERQLDQGRRRIADEERAARERLADDARRTAVKVAASLIAKVAGRPFHRALLDQVLETGLRFDGAQTEQFRRALEHAGRAVTVETAYPVPEEVQAQLHDAIAKALGPGPDLVRVSFDVTPSLMAGLRIMVGGGVVDLSLRHTLDDLERHPLAGEP
jgi:F-type H+-transporting ATPase subunit b